MKLQVCTDLLFVRPLPLWGWRVGKDEFLCMSGNSIPFLAKYFLLKLTPHLMPFELDRGKITFVCRLHLSCNF